MNTVSYSSTTEYGIKKPESMCSIPVSTQYGKFFEHLLRFLEVLDNLQSKEIMINITDEIVTKKRKLKPK